ncbi:hypothetical protein [Nonomuraea sp. NPDC050691]|uniref:hypothetical protein n=1 Tax=Nonomuraea sp. NPDC050691 TaxID=3155661 RepID=UPI0033F928C1
MFTYYWLHKIARVVAGAILATAQAATPAYAARWPDGWFLIYGATEDPFQPFSHRSMDTLWDVPRNAPVRTEVTEFVRLASSNNWQDSQVWRVRFPVSGSIGQARVVNKLTGTCLAARELPVTRGGEGALHERCGDPGTLWWWEPMGGNKFVLRSTESPICLSKAEIFEDPEFLRLRSCSGHAYDAQMTWEWHKWVS